MLAKISGFPSFWVSLFSNGTYWDSVIADNIVWKSSPCQHVHHHGEYKVLTFPSTLRACYRVENAAVCNQQ
nr:hypothetical protein [uncultured Noviherbaspirillum sp.]